jgi:hypothetical protein
MRRLVSPLRTVQATNSGLHVQVNVIPLDRVVDDSEPATLARDAERALECGHEAGGAKRRDVTPNLQRDVTGMLRRQGHATTMR